AKPNRSRMHAISTRAGVIWQCQPVAGSFRRSRRSRVRRNHSTRRNKIFTVRSERSARVAAQRIPIKNVVQLKTSFCMAEIQVMRSQQVMGLCPDVGDTHHHALAQLALDRQVVLLGVLCFQMWLEFTEEEHRAELRKICLGFGICRDHALERIRREWPVNGIARKRHEWQVEVGPREKDAASKRRLGAELFHHELLDRIVKYPVTGSHARLARPPSYFSKPAVRPARTPGHTDS